MHKHTSVVFAAASAGLTGFLLGGTVNTGHQTAQPESSAVIVPMTVSRTVSDQNADRPQPAIRSALTARRTQRFME